MSRKTEALYVKVTHVWCEPGKSYRPISNLSVISKLLERLIAIQLVRYLNVNNLLQDLQSAYRPHQSTETAVLKVLADILLALDLGNFVMLTLLDLSAAIDNVDHNTLLCGLRKSYVLRGVCFDCPDTVRALYIDQFRAV